MFKRILVPLDGSVRAERAIPVAARIARHSGGVVVLLEVVSPPIDYRVSMAQGLVLTEPAMEEDIAASTNYLTDIARSDKLADVGTEKVVIPGAVASTIFSVISDHHIDLVVMCSHGDTGIRRWMLGSVAQKVARHSPVPVFVLREDGSTPAGPHPDATRPLRILVALDGSPLAEAALMPAAELIAALTAPAPGAVHLARVLRLPPLKDKDSHDVVAEMTRQALQDAKDDMRAVEQRLHEGAFAAFNLQVTYSVVLDTDVAGTLIKMAEIGEDVEGTSAFGGCDIITMATHGRGGMQRWTLGSMTERVLGATSLPLLIVRPLNVDVEGGSPQAARRTEAEAQTWGGIL